MQTVFASFFPWTRAHGFEVSGECAPAPSLEAPFWARPTAKKTKATTAPPTSDRRASAGNTRDMIAPFSKWTDEWDIGSVSAAIVQFAELHRQHRVFQCLFRTA